MSCRHGFIQFPGGGVCPECVRRGFATPRERYLGSAAFKALVDVLEAQIRMANFSPSEIREAAMLACIKHEMETVRYGIVTPKGLEDAIRRYKRWVNGEEEEPTKRDQGGGE